MHPLMTLISSALPLPHSHDGDAMGNRLLKRDQYTWNKSFTNSPKLYGS